MSAGRRRGGSSGYSEEENLVEMENVKGATRKRKSQVEELSEYNSATQGDTSEEPRGMKRRLTKEKRRSVENKGEETEGRMRREKETRADTEDEGTSEEEAGEERRGTNVGGKMRGEETESIARRIMKETNRILEAISREQNGKISVSRKEQSEVRGAVAVIVTQLGEIMARQMEKEREVSKMREELQALRREGQQRSESSMREKRNERQDTRVSRGGAWPTTGESGESSDGFTEVRRRQRTYAEVSKNGGSKKVERTRVEGRVVVVGKEGWKTPPPVVNENALIITSREGKGGKELAKALAKSLPAKDIGGAPQAVRETRDGKVVVVPKNKEQQEKITQKVRQMKEVEVREKKKAEPLLIISGVAASTTDKDIIEQLVRGLDGSVDGGIKVVKRMPCRNPWKENVVVRMGVNGFKTIVKRGKVELGCMLYVAEEYLDMPMCFRCCRFGHFMKYCKEKQVCAKCGGEHDLRECKNERVRCINCYRMYGRVETHSARDRGCPALCQTLEKSRKNVSYGA